MRIPQMFGVLVDDGGDDALHGAELRVEAEEHEHEEEEAAPEGGERHLEDRAGVRQERKTGAWKFTSKPIETDLCKERKGLQMQI